MTCLGKSLVRLSSGSCLTAVALLLAARCRGDEWEFPRRVSCRSESGEFVLKVTPDAEGAKRPGLCSAVMFHIQGGSTNQVWSRFLVNDVAPIDVLVSNSGYAVSLDEWHRPGHLPMVIYGPRGRLIQVHNLESLGLLGRTTQKSKET